MKSNILSLLFSFQTITTYNMIQLLKTTKYSTLHCRLRSDFVREKKCNLIEISPQRQAIIKHLMSEWRLRHDCFMRSVSSRRRKVGKITRRSRILISAAEPYITVVHPTDTLCGVFLRRQECPVQLGSKLQQYFLSD